MDKRAVIFVEGKADGRFIKCCLDHLRIQTAHVNIYDMGGLGALRSQDSQHIKKSRLYKELTLVDVGLFVLDANDSFDLHKQLVDDFKGNTKRYPQGVVIESFLLPDDQNAGALETLLKAISVKQEIYGCFAEYKQCLKRLACPGAPDEKAEIYAYCEANAIDPGGIDYHEPQYWNMDAPCLQPLKHFLTAQLGGS